MSAQNARAEAVAVLLVRTILEAMSENEGADFIMAMSEAQAEDRDMAARVSRRFGGLPLALSQMSRLIQKQHMSFEEFLKRYEVVEERWHLLSFESVGRHKARRGTLASLFAAEQLHVYGSRRLLEISSTLDPDCIHDFLLTEEAVGHLKLKDFPHRIGDFYEARGELLNGCLIQRDGGGKDYSMHRLIRDVVRATMSERQLFDTCRDTMSILQSAWGSTALDKRHTVGKWHRKQAIFSHVMTIKRLWDGTDAKPDAAFNLQCADLLQ